MSKSFCPAFLAGFLFCVLWPTTAAAQGSAGTIAGTVTDTDHDVLPAAPVKLEPGGIAVKTNDQGEFTITNVAPGVYTVTATYVGFAPSEMSVTVAAGQAASVNPSSVRCSARVLQADLQLWLSLGSPRLMRRRTIDYGMMRGQQRAGDGPSYCLGHSRAFDPRAEDLKPAG